MIERKFPTVYLLGLIAFLPLFILWFYILYITLPVFNLWNTIFFSMSFLGFKGFLFALYYNLKDYILKGNVVKYYTKLIEDEEESLKYNREVLKEYTQYVEESEKEIDKYKAFLGKNK